MVYPKTTITNNIDHKLYYVVSLRVARLAKSQSNNRKKEEETILYQELKIVYCVSYLM